MRSQLYECQVAHARFSPKAHRFVYRIFMFAFDLDELDSLSQRLALFSSNRANLYSFRERDYLPLGEPLHNSPGRGPDDSSLISPTPRLKERVVNYLADHQIDLRHGRVVLVTLPRIFGYLFNPVSFYFCFDATGAPVAALAEVTNTFREMKPYFIGQPETIDGRTHFRVRLPKHFYVSPFSDVDTAFDFDLTVPGDRLNVKIDDYTDAVRTLTSSVAGPSRELTNGRLAWFTLKYPLLTLRIIGLIHWHALILWLKRVPWFAKAARATDQRSLYRPHRSIANPSDVS